MLSSFRSLKILDFTGLLPGPFASRMLADLGAQVIKIESAKRPDMTRSLAPFINGKSAIHASLNRNKKSLGLDLKHPQAKDIVLRLLKEYDILIEGFRPGVMSRLGLGYDELSQAHSRLIYCSISGYGQNGPLRERAGHDINYLALSGLASYSGKEGPCLMGSQIADLAGGSYHAVIGILAAYIQRLQTGQGQHIDISMTDCVSTMNTLAAASLLAGGSKPNYESELLNGGSWYDYYQTKDNRYFAVGSLEPQFLMALLEVMGLSEYLEPCLANKTNTVQFVKEQLKAQFKTKTFAEWREIFAQLDACVEPVLELDEALHSPQMKERQLLFEVSDSQNRRFQQLKMPIQFSKAEDFQALAGEDLGESSYQILEEIGFSEEEINALIKSQAVMTS